MNNLVSNTIKYCNPLVAKPFTHIQIVVKIDKVNIVIKDNGIGISEKHINKIFDMFYRASKYSSGTGLGLYIVKETVAKLGGKIEVISRVNEGTTFSVLLPNHLQAG